MTLEGKSEELEFQEMLSSPHWKIEMSKNKTKMLKKKNQEKWKKWKEWEMNERIMKNDLSRNDPWSDHPETQFEPTYPFFWNHKPWPALCTWKVPFDWTWILGLKRFFLEKFFIINKAVVFFPQPTKKSWSIFHLFGMNFELSSA